MQNFIDTGQDWRVTLGSGETGVKSGSGYLKGTRVGIVSVVTRNGNTVFNNAASAQGDIIVLKLTGTYAVAKTAGEAWTQGAAIYWNDTTKAFTTTVSTNVLAGEAESDALSAAVVGNLRLRG